jgi:hypothetical protein
MRDSNPFAPAPAEEAPVEAPAEEAQATEAVVATQVVEVDESADEPTEDPGADYGKFSPKNPRAGWVPKPRLDRVITERNKLRADKDALAKNAAKLQGKLEQVAELNTFVVEKYKNNPEAIKFDARFMDELEVLAKTDVTTQALVSKIKASMGEPATVTTPESDKSTETAPEAAQASEAVISLIRNTSEQALTGHLKAAGVKPHFARLVAQDVAGTADPARLAEVDADLAVEAAKVYFERNDIPFEEFATGKAVKEAAEAQKASAPKTSPTGGAVVAPRQGAPGTESGPKPAATIEEFQANKRARFTEMASEFVKTQS